MAPNIPKLFWKILSSSCYATQGSIINYRPVYCVLVYNLIIATQAPLILVVVAKHDISPKVGGSGWGMCIMSRLHSARLTGSQADYSRALPWPWGHTL